MKLVKSEAYLQQHDRKGDDRKARNAKERKARLPFSK